MKFEQALEKMREGCKVKIDNISYFYIDTDIIWEVSSDNELPAEFTLEDILSEEWEAL